MLTRRQNDILHLIIQHYTSGGMPVGSETLMSEGIKASSAATHNDMKALENEGLLLETHPSSGRIPSALGYHYYMDHLLKPAHVAEGDLLLVRQSLGREFHEISETIGQSVEILSELTSYTTFSLGPEIEDRRLTDFRIIPLNSWQIIVIVITDTGNIEDQVFTLPEYMGGQELERMVRIVNDRLVGDSLMTVYHKLRMETLMVPHKYFQTTERVSQLFDTVFGRIFEDKVYVSGQMNLLDYEPRQGLDQLRSMFPLMKDSDRLTQMITPMDNDTHIKIGAELGNDLLQNTSIIQTGYEIDGRGRDTVVLLGPTSMPYSRMFGLVDVCWREPAARLAGYYRSLDSSNS